MSLVASKSNRGFSLLEVMIVVVIVGILASIAYPSYREHVLRGNRVEGQALLMEAAARQERFYAQNNSYVTSDTNRSQLNVGESKYAKYYTLSVGQTANDGGYTLTATQQFGDSACGNLTLNARGEKGRTGSGKTQEECWR